jgi:hypothetical protein
MVGYLVQTQHEASLVGEGWEFPACSFSLTHVAAKRIWGHFHPRASLQPGLRVFDMRPVHLLTYIWDMIAGVRTGA